MGIGRAVARFALSGLAAVVLLSVVGVDLLRRTGTSEAIRNAKEVTRLAGRGIVEPVTTDGLVRGDPRALARVDDAVRSHLLEDPVVRVKIWAPTGRIVYSDELRLVGSTYELGEEELETLEHGGVDAEVSDLSEPENRFERRYGKLLEVYLPIETPSGRKLLFESYLRFSSVSASGRRLWLAFAPAIIGALLLLELTQVPFAWGLARRIREGQREREELLRRALEASDVERRRIARDLHDGVVQSLAGLSYSLAAAEEKANDPVAEDLRDAAAETRGAIRELRTLLVEIYPPDLHRTGLESALGDLVAPLANRGIDAKVVVESGVELPQDVEALFFRTAQEAIRNVVRHAHADSVEISVARRDGHAELAVVDDGRGFDVGEPHEGHFGLRLVRDATADAGGTFRLDSAPGQGTRVSVEVPLR